MAPMKSRKKVLKSKEMALVKNNNGAPNLLEMVTRFYQSIFTLSPEELIPQILTEAAKVFKADIATWFLVSEDRTQLRLVDVYNERGERTLRPEIEPYDLNWNVSAESRVRGVTAWVAVSGKPLFVPSLDSLLNEHGDAHMGKWDKWLYPERIEDPNSGFLCLYAVPLFLPIETPIIQDRIVGVLKVERRAYRKEVFTEEERKAFDVIANVMGFAYIHSERQKSLTLLDIGHTLIRPLGDVAISLDIVAACLHEDQTYEKKELDAACKRLRGLSKMLTIAKDSFNEPKVTTTVSLREVIAPQLDVFSLSSGRLVSYLPKNDPIITINKRALAALLTIVVNLVDNAIRYSIKGSKIEVQCFVENRNVILRIENKGLEIPKRDLNGIHPTQDRPEIFRGLPRSYQLAARNGWELKYLYVQNINRFDVIIPLPGTSDEVTSEGGEIK